MAIMAKTRVNVLVLLALLLGSAGLLVACGPDPGGDRDADAEDVEQTGVVGGPAAPTSGDPDALASAVVREDLVFTPEDVEIFHEIMEWARSERLDTLAFGDMLVTLGRRFVDDPYTPQTLETPGPERVVINLREFDCVTYLESVLALGRVIRERRTDFEAFAGEIERIRYRDGRLDGYVSRLHYFSEWISDNERLGLLRDITTELGGRVIDEPIDFMSTHAEAYPRLADSPERVEEIREIERKLSSRSRSYIPQRQIGEVAERIRNGDIIAATSSVRGLDVAHTGFALWQDGRLHLMHAPLVGKSLEISDQPLAIRIMRIDGQDGIMAARPL